MEVQVQVNFFVTLVLLVCAAAVVNSELENGGKARILNNPSAARKVYKCPGSKLKLEQALRVSAEWVDANRPVAFLMKQGFRRCQNHTLTLLQATRNLEHFNVTLSGQVKVDNDYYDVNEYCWNDYRPDGLSITVCNTTCGKYGTNPCLTKCCEIGHSMNWDTQVCEPDQDPMGYVWKPKMYKSPSVQVVGEERAGILPHVTRTLPQCVYPNGSLSKDHDVFPSMDLEGFTGVEMRLMADGSLMMFIVAEQRWVSLEPGSFCVEELHMDVAGNSNVKDTDLLVTRPFIAIVCSIYTEEWFWMSIFYVVALYISAFFLLLTALVYGLLWDTHNVHGWTILFYVISMFLLYVFLGTANLVNLVLGSDDLYFALSCRIIGIIVHFFFLSTFAWLTMINIDLWSTFRSHKPAGERSKGTVRFLVYNAIAWGLAFVIVAASVAIDLYYPSGIYGFPAPEYGRANCFVTPQSKGYYLYSEAGILMLVNIVFIGLTSWTIYQFKKATRTVHSLSTSRSSGGQQSFALFFKLFIIMGVTWVFDVISSITTPLENTALYWVLCDLLNCAQGIAIFVIFICKRKSLKQLKQRLSELCPCWFSGSLRSSGTQRSTRSGCSATTGLATSSYRISSVKQQQNQQGTTELKMQSKV